MELLPKEVEERFNKIGCQEGEKDPIVIVKFFNPCGAGTWWATELIEYHLRKINKDSTENWQNTFSYEEKEKALKEGFEVDDVIFFGYVSIFGDHCDEWGSFSLKELKEIKGLGGLGIERDLYCGEQKISEFKIPTLQIKE